VPKRVLGKAQWEKLKAYREVETDAVGFLWIKIVRFSLFKIGRQAKHGKNLCLSS